MTIINCDNTTIVIEEKNIKEETNLNKLFNIKNEEPKKIIRRKIIKKEIIEEKNEKTSELLKKLEKKVIENKDGKNEGNTRSLVEEVDYIAGLFIIEKYEYIKNKLRSSTLEDNDYEPLTIIKKYMKRVKDGKVKINYYQNNGRGRYYTNKEMVGYQMMLREFRHTLARKIYYDLDIKNCHPVILSQYCKHMNIKCLSLENYNKNRDNSIQEIITLNNITKDEAKDVIVCLLNGGYKAYDKLINKPEWLTYFTPLHI